MQNRSLAQATSLRLVTTWNFIVDVLRLYGEARARKTLELYHPGIARLTAPSCVKATSSDRSSAGRSSRSAHWKPVTSRLVNAG